MHLIPKHKERVPLHTGLLMVLLVYFLKADSRVTKS